MADITITKSFSAFGRAVHGSSVFGAPVEDSITIETPNYEGWRRATLGFGHFGRVGRRSYPFQPRRITPGTSGGFSFLSFSTATGALLGRIRTDVRDTIVHSLEFTIDSNGCADFTLTLNALPPFPIQATTMVSVNLFQTEFEWFSGIVDVYPLSSTANGQYVFKGFGVRKRLADLAAEKTYPAPMDVGEIVDDIMENFVFGRAPIVYNSSLIDQNTGVLTASVNELSSADIGAIFGSYADMANCRWWVTGDREFRFEKRNSEPKKVFFAGVHAGSFDVSVSAESVKNSIFVKRQQGKGSGGAGWAVAAIATDKTSANLYQTKELEYQMKGFFSDADCQVVADALLEEKKDPKPYARIEGIPLRSSDDYLAPGVYKIVMPMEQFEIVGSECDDASAWVVNQEGGTDLAVTADDTLFMSGAASLRLSWTDGAGARVYTTTAVRGKILRVRAHLYAEQAGLFVRFGVGYGSFLQHTRPAAVNLARTWIPFEWDLTGLELFDLNEVGFEVVADGPGSVLIDRIVFDVVGAKHYDCELTTARYRITPDEQTVSAEFGPPPETMDKFVANLQAQVKENTFVAEVR